MFRLLTLTFLLMFGISQSVQPALLGQVSPNSKKYNQEDKFRQLEEILPTPNEARTASGAPAHRYWQQKVDYEIEVAIDDATQQLTGSETITYLNQSPDSLRYLWLQLDGNLFRPDAESKLIQTLEQPDKIDLGRFSSVIAKNQIDGGFNISRCVATDSQKPLPFTIVKTMMRVDLPEPLQTGETFRFTIDWNQSIVNAKKVRARGGYEFFEKDQNYIYEMAQWFPRLCAYTDSTGWQHKQYLGSGEFTLELGDYVVRITMPDDHVVTATGVLMNPEQVLSPQQRERLKQAGNSNKPVFIVTPEEAKQNESSRSKTNKAWIFKADQVRDFAFASSRKFIWDAWEHRQGEAPVMAMSLYPNEAEPLWSKYSTHAIIHTLNVYSRYTFDYPYPVAISVNGPVGGMEYPMICFNGPRPEPDGTYSARTKYGLISVVIHEVGHNYFPMIVNSDERQWTWMDEGLNTFLQFLAEKEWEEAYPSRRGEPRDIVSYMLSENQVPVMTNSDSLLQFGPNAYAKPATALNILRETILGRELFDFAFKEYARRWKFKRPMPADFFRTMEDASGVDLDWFWRGWFYSTDHVDLGIASVRVLDLNSLHPEIEKSKQREIRDNQPKSLSVERNQSLEKRVDLFPELKDFYNEYDPLSPAEDDQQRFQMATAHLTETQREALLHQGQCYVFEFENVGGLVMPVILDIEFEDGTVQHLRIPAEIWNKNNQRVFKIWPSEKPIVSVTLDPRLETADAELSNNTFPRKIQKSRFELFVDEREKKQPNPMKQRVGNPEATPEASKPDASHQAPSPAMEKQIDEANREEMPKDENKPQKKKKKKRQSAEAAGR